MPTQVEGYEGSNSAKTCLSACDSLPMHYRVWEIIYVRHAKTDEEIDINFMQNECLFCRTKMIMVSIENRWGIDEDMLRVKHEEGINVLVTEVDEYYTEHREIISEFYSNISKFYLCQACGWWCIIQMIQYDTPRMPYMAYQWAAGAIAQQQFPDIDAPISQVRSYLCARFAERFDIDPSRLEDVTASIFRSFGCTVELTSRSNDGGIDIFGFDRRGRTFGVQVKRYRRRIGVEHLRAFVGALLLSEKPCGVFVTTSDFTNGASGLCKQARLRGIRLKCAGAENLFDMIKAAQIRDFDFANLQEIVRQYSDEVPRLSYGLSMHMNSL